MLLQSEKDLGPYVNKYGCYMMSILFHAMMARRKPMTASEVIAIYVSAKASGLIGPEKADKDGHPIDGCYVNDPAMLYHVAGGGHVLIKKVDGLYQCKADEREILAWFNARTNFTHFTAGNGSGVCVYDPLGQSITRSEGVIISKRILVGII
jgi:hypothetical protein